MILVVLISVFKIFAITLTVIFSALYIYFKSRYRYWDSKNIPCAKPVFPFGNLTGIISSATCVIFKKIYDESKHLRYYGLWLFHKPVLMINDPDLIKRILVENFSDFHSNGSSFDNGNNVLFTETLFSLEGSRWRNLRGKISPIFSSGKLKTVFPLMVQCGRDLQDVIDKAVEVNDVIDVKRFSARFVLCVITSTAFGMEINHLKNPYNETGKMMYEVLKPGLMYELKLFVALYIPRLARMLKLSFSSKKQQDFFVKMLRDLVDFREKNNFSRNDCLQLLIELLKKGCADHSNASNANRFTFENLVCQVMTFLMSGHETTTQSLQWSLYELALNQNVQKKLRNEIRTVLAKHNKEITYEAVGEMEYLGRVVSETLRKYPVGGDMMRKCRNGFKDPSSDLFIEKNTNVFIFGFGIHRDERYYPNPDLFDPDRFTEENIASRPGYTYLPFGEGPRCCIGQRYAMLLIKIGLISILSRYHFKLSELFPNMSAGFDPQSFAPAPRGEIMLKISRAD